MAGPISPKETIYGGITFRSRLEAKWAVCFDTAGVKWQYEPFVLKDNNTGWTYTPDFYITSNKGCFVVEVKPNYPSAEYTKQLSYWSTSLKNLLYPVSTSIHILCGNFYDIPIVAYKLQNTKPIPISLSFLFPRYLMGLQQASAYRFDLENPNDSQGLHQLPTGSSTRKRSNGVHRRRSKPPKRKRRR